MMALYDCRMEWLKNRLAEVGRKPIELARHLGVPPARVYEMLAGKRRLQPGEYRAAAAFLAWPEARVLALAAGETEQDNLPEVIPAPNTPLPPMRQEMAKDVPVYGTTLGGDGQGEFHFNGEVIDYVRRPPRLVGRKDVFVLYVQGSSMSPWREPGQMVYLEQNRPPRPGEYIVIEMAPSPGEEVKPAMIKRLVSTSPARIRLRQYNPDKEFDVDRTKVRAIYRVMDWDELMGV